MVVLPPGGVLQTPTKERKTSIGVASNSPANPPEPAPNTPSSPTAGNQRRANRMGKLIKVVAENLDSKVFSAHYLFSYNSILLFDNLHVLQCF